MNRIKQVLAVMLSAGLMLMAAPTFAQPDITSGPTSVSLSMSVGESLSISTNIGSVTFTYNPTNGTATASAPIVATTQYAIASGHAYYSIDAWLSSATAALSGSAGTNIPSSEVFAAVNGGSAAPCNNGVTWGGNLGVANAICGTMGVGGASLAIVQNPPAGTGTTTTTVLLSLSGLGNLTPQTFTGTLVLEAEAD